jgi:hypothetical protein
MSEREQAARKARREAIDQAVKTYDEAVARIRKEAEVG